MENVDTDRMKRVLDRLYPPPPLGPPPGRPPGPMGTKPPPPPREPVCALEKTEQRLRGELSRVFRHCRECRRVLSPVQRRSQSRSAWLRAECFLSGPGAEPFRRPEHRDGTLASLRGAYRTLEMLAEGYARAGEECRRHTQRYDTYVRECRRDAELVRGLIVRLMK